MLASLGVLKSVADVNRKIVMTLTSDYEMQEITILYREGVTKAEIESIVRQRYLRLSTSKGKSVGQALFSNGVARGGLAGSGKHRSNSRSRNGDGKGSSSSNPKPPHKTPRQLSTK